MKKSFMTRVLAVSLSTAMAFSVPVVGNLTTALADTASSSSAALAMNYTQKNAEAGTRMVFKLQGSQAKYWKVLRAASQNKEVATVDNTTSKKVAVNAVSEGSANIIVRVEKTAGKKSVGKQKRLKIAIDVEKGAVKTAQLTAAAQEKGTLVNATMSEAVESVNAADFEIRRDDDNAVIPVKSATVDSADKTKVALETYNAMKDGKTYTVTYTAKVEGGDDVVSKAQFTATDGTVADVSVTPVTVPAGKATAIKVQELDANGVIVLEDGFNAASDSKLECSITPANGYTTDDKLYLPNEGDTAVATVTYHTYKYNTDGTEDGAIKKEITITAVPDTTTVTNYQMTVANQGAKPAWGASTFTATNRLMVGVPSQEAYFFIKDSNGDEITDYTEYKFASSDESKMIVESDTVDGNNGVNVTGVAAGTAYIMISKNNAVVQTLSVTVVAASKATSITLDKSSASISSVENVGVATFNATVKDQYGSEMASNQSYPTTYTFEVLNAPAGADKNVAVSAVSATGYRTIKVDGSALVQSGAYGTYTIRANATVKGPDGNDATVKTTFSVNVIKTDDVTAQTYALELGNTVDTTVTDATGADAATTIKVAIKKKGVVVGYKTGISSITIAKPNGSTLFAQSADEKVKTVTNAAVNSESAFDSLANVSEVKVVGMEYNNGATNKVLSDTGNYKVTVKFTADGKENTLSGNFIVKNTQEAATINVKNTDAENDALESFFANTDKVSITYQGIAQDNVTVTKVDKSGTGTTQYVKSIDVRVKVPGNNGNTVIVNIPVNKTIYKVAASNN